MQFFFELVDGTARLIRRVMAGPLRLCLLLISLPAYVYGQTPWPEEVRLLNRTFKENHISLPKIDDAYSAVVFDLFIENIDPDRLIFLQGDLEALARYRHTVDEELEGREWSFISSLTPLFRNGQERLLRLLETIGDEEVMVVKGPYHYDVAPAPTEAVLKGRVKTLLRLEMAERLLAIRGGHPELSDEEFVAKQSVEALARARRFFVRSIERTLHPAGGIESQLSERYLQAMAMAFDPHSNYLSETAIENFITSLSNQGYFFGFAIGENERGEVNIESLSPGGPAWRSGLISSGDIIRGLQWEGSDYVNLDGATLEEVDEILTQDNHAGLTLELVNAAGVIKRVTLRKEKMTNSDNIVRSFILEREHKVGYISLPGFYTDWGDEDGGKCARDVATEIIRLKQEGIDALIFDLRLNGGGSLEEAVAMVGIFIDAGPVLVTRDRNGEQVLKDFNRGAVYDGPLVVMVNGFSASASEIVAAALQDYNRAVIVGSPTFGKSTGQAIIPLRETVSATTSAVSCVSVTVQKIFRVTRGTAQLSGVIPDIYLPDIYDSIPYREIFLPGALPADSALKETWFRPRSGLPLADLRERSESRVASNTHFERIRKFSGYIGSLQSRDGTTLDPVAYLREAAPLREFLAVLESPDPPAPRFEISNHAFDSRQMEIDEYLRSINAAWCERIVRDVQLAEAVDIANDHIVFQQK